MEKFDFIKTKLGFGCMRFPNNDGVIDTAEVNKMVDYFIENGFNYFDTARGYHNGKSELTLKECLTSRYPRDKYLLTNKLTEPYFKSEEDAMRKFKLANKLSPFMTAMFANSPIRGGVDTGYKSFRALSWLNTDNDRCGFAGKISEEFSFEDYIDTVMKTPMIFIQREKQPIVINGNVTFEEFLNHGYDNISANIDDYELHANLCFPEVRLRNFIEIRNHDCVGGDLKYAILAIYKGIFYDNNAMSETEDLLKGLQYRDFSEMRYNVPKCAMQTAVKNYKIADYAKEILKIAEKSLKNAQTGENLFLNSIKEYTMKGLCPADVILKKWNGVWNKDLGKMIKYLTELENNV